MADQPHGFTQARSRLEEIVTQVRKKDTSLEKSLDLLEEGVRLANQCTELIDHADWEAAAPAQDAEAADADGGDEVAVAAEGSDAGEDADVEDGDASEGEGLDEGDAGESSARPY